MGGLRKNGMATQHTSIPKPFFTCQEGHDSAPHYCRIPAWIPTQIPTVRLSAHPLFPQKKLVTLFWCHFRSLWTSNSMIMWFQWKGAFQIPVRGPDSQSLAENHYILMGNLDGLKRDWPYHSLWFVVLMACTSGAHEALLASTTEWLSTSTQESKMRFLSTPLLEFLCHRLSVKLAAALR